MQESVKKDSSLSEDAYTHLKNKICRGDLTPRSLIHVGNVAKVLGVSHSPIKEALINLEHEGLVEILPRRGARILDHGPAELQRYYQTTGLFESFIINTYSDKVTSPLLSKLHKINLELQTLVKEENHRQVVKIDSLFHEQLTSISGNPLLSGRLRTLRTLFFSKPSLPLNASYGYQHVEEHFQLLAYLEKGHAKKAADFLQKVHWSEKI